MTSSRKTWSVCIAMVALIYYVKNASSENYNRSPTPNIKKMTLSAPKPGHVDAYRLFNQLKEYQKTRRQVGQEKMPVWEQADIEKLKLWSNGVVPYLIDESSYDEELRNGLKNYLDVMQRETDLTFLHLSKPPRDIEKVRFAIITNRRMSQECVPLETLTNTGVQRVVIGYECMGQKDLGSLVIQLLGVPPQHNSPDRDSFINIHEENILDDKKHLFEKVSPDLWPFKTLLYDFASISHFEPTAFTKNGKATISIKENYSFNNTIGLTEHFSAIDKMKIKILYDNINQQRELKRVQSSCLILFDTALI